jgi:prevent-host-death family protein
VRSIPITLARQQLHRLVDEVATSGEAVQISGPRTDAVLVSANDWRALQETLLLVSVPGMRQSIREGLETPLDRCGKSPGW